MRPAKKKIDPAPSTHTGRLIAISIALIALVWLVFGQTLADQFTNYDDSAYVYENPIIEKGLSFPGIAWAFTHAHGGNWHPLTSISHEIDCSLFGLNASLHHLSNVLLHTIAVVALFFLLRLMTGAVWRSAFVAALFAIHPLRVESVAWIAERKDVLSGVFFMLSLGCYVRYVQQPSRGRYWLALGCFACGLMAKPMLVTLPLVLLILDYWPLKRFGADFSTKSKSLLLEKLPFFALAAGSSLITLLVQKQAIATVGQLPIGWRVMNAFVSCLVYLREMIWPTKLGLFYPFPNDDGLVARGLLSLAALALITVLVFLARKTRPYLLAGWLWYLVMLLPVIGIVQVGMQAHADRYTYLPQIGLYLALTWGIADLSFAWPRRQPILATCAGMVLAILTFGAWKEASYWRDSETIWRHTLAVTEKNAVADAGLGDTLLEQHRYAEAIPNYEEALRNKPDDAHSESNLAYAFRMTGRLDDAIASFKKAVQLSANQSDIENANTHENLGNALLEKKQTDEAIVEFREAVTLHATEEECTTLANVLFQKGRVAEAIPEYEKALKLNPDSGAVLTYLSWALATAADPALRNGPRAVELATRADQLAGDRVPSVGRSLAAAEAETGRFAEAVATAQRALTLAESQNDRRMLNVLRKELALYQSGRPYHGAAP